MRGPHCLRTWSSTQGPIALSSAEAEYYAMLNGVVKATGLQAMAAELGVKGLGGPIGLYTDSTAAKSFASRRGLGRVRHVETRRLWLQREVAEGRVRVHKVLGTENPADVLTKYLSQEAAARAMGRMGVALGWRS